MDVRLQPGRSDRPGSPDSRATRHEASLRHSGNGEDRRLESDESRPGKGPADSSGAFGPTDWDLCLTARPTRVSGVL
jgi:hypothetical protein